MFIRQATYDKLTNDLETKNGIIAENEKTIERLTDENEKLSAAFAYKEANRLLSCKHALCRECKYCILVSDVEQVTMYMRSRYSVMFCAKDIECGKFERKE